MRGRAPQGNAIDDDILIWVFVLLFFGALALWYFGHTHIAYFIMHVRLFEARLIGFIDPQGRDEIYRWIASTHPSNTTLNELWTSGAVAGYSLRWVVGAILAALLGWLLYRSPEVSPKYNKRYSMESLAKQESVEWPTIIPVLGEGLAKVSLDDPIDGMRQTARAYGRKHGFVVSHRALDGLGNVSAVEKIDDKEVLRLDRAAVVFGKQLGRLWQGVNEMRPHEKSLFAAFAAQIGNDNSLAQSIIADLARAYVNAREKKDAALIVSPLADAALERYGHTKAVNAITARHAYVRTVLVSMLSGARQNGVLPACWFRWLKPTDRVTWYALSDLGIDQASAEAAGIRAHWLAESMSRTAIVNPMIEPAIDGVKIYLREISDVEHTA